MSLSQEIPFAICVVYFGLIIGTAVRLRIMAVPWSFVAYSPWLCLYLLVVFPAKAMTKMLFEPQKVKSDTIAQKHKATRALAGIKVGWWIIKNYPIMLDFFVILRKKTRQMNVFNPESEFDAMMLLAVKGSLEGNCLF